MASLSQKVRMASFWNCKNSEFILGLSKVPVLKCRNVKKMWRYSISAVLVGTTDYWVYLLPADNTAFKSFRVYGPVFAVKNGRRWSMERKKAHVVFKL